MWEAITQLFPFAIAFSIPLLVTSLGGLYSERSGVVNVGLEGFMLSGAFFSALTIRLLKGVVEGNTAIWISLLVAVAATAVFSLLHAFACVSLNANHVISGTAINMMALALTVYFARTITGSGNISIGAGLSRSNIPLLSDIPVLGPLFFRQSYPTTWVVALLLLVSWYLLYRTPFGLRLRACGEHPHAADSAGVNVYRMRTVAVLISGGLAGLGGAIVLVTVAGEFSATVTAGLGFLSLAALIFGQWKPLGILGATFFFGTATTVANFSMVFPTFDRIPNGILRAFPYVITLFALILSSRSSRAPLAAGQPYDKGQR